MISAAQVSIENIHPNGIILRRLGNVFTYGKTARLIIATPQEEYRRQQKLIENYVQEIKTLAKASKNKNLFNNMLFEFGEITSTINDMNKLIDKAPQRRQKRDLWMIYGLILEFFFGWTEIEETSLWNHIDNMDNKMILSSATHTFDTINAIEKHNNHSDDKIQNIINKLNELIINSEGNFDEIAHENKIHDLMQFLTLAIIRYKSFQNKLITYLLKSQPSQIDPEIIPVSYFIAMMDEIEQKLDNFSVLPWRLINNLEFVNWYKLIPMKISLMAGNIITEIAVPLVSTGKREIYETFSVPSPNNKVLDVIKTEAPFFVTTEKRNKIGYLSRIEFEKCWEAMNNYICPQTFPLYTISNDSSYCELDILKNNKDQSKNCKTYSIPQKDILLKLNQDNQYYFYVIKPIKMIAKCGNKTNNVTLNNTGIMSIPNNCLVYNERIQIAAQSQMNIRKELKYIVSNYTDTNRTITKTQEQSFDQEDLFVSNQNFEDIKNKILQETINYKKWLEDNKGFSFTSILTFIAIGITLIMSIICAIKCFC